MQVENVFKSAKLRYGRGSDLTRQVNCLIDSGLLVSIWLTIGVNTELCLTQFIKTSTVVSSCALFRNLEAIIFYLSARCVLRYASSSALFCSITFSASFFKNL